MRGLLGGLAIGALAAPPGADHDPFAVPEDGLWERACMRRGVHRGGDIAAPVPSRESLLADADFLASATARGRIAAEKEGASDLVAATAVQGFAAAGAAHYLDSRRAMLLLTLTPPLPPPPDIIVLAFLGGRADFWGDKREDVKFR